MSYPKICQITFEEYQDFIANISQKFELLNSDDRLHLMVATLGLVGEAGEVANLVKKYLRGDDIAVDKLREELGDVLAYISLLCSKFDLDLESVAMQNTDKLKSRQKDNKLMNH